MHLALLNALVIFINIIIIADHWPQSFLLCCPPQGDLWCDFISFVLTDSVSSTSMLQIFQDASHSWCFVRQHVNVLSRSSQLQHVQDSNCSRVCEDGQPNIATCQSGSLWTQSVICIFYSNKSYQADHIIAWTERTQYKFFTHCAQRHSLSIAYPSLHEVHGVVPVIDVESCIIPRAQMLSQAQLPEFKRTEEFQLVPTQDHTWKAVDISLLTLYDLNLTDFYLHFFFLFNMWLVQWQIILFLIIIKHPDKTEFWPILVSAVCLCCFVSCKS